MEFFRNPGNRIMVNFDGYGMVPVATNLDDEPVYYYCYPPQRIGDEVNILVEGKARKVRLLKSSGMAKNATYLVDMGPAFDRRRKIDRIRPTRGAIATDRGQA